MTNKNVQEIEDLIKIISKLPGLGPKSAKRIVLRLINKREELVMDYNRIHLSSVNNKIQILKIFR